PTTPSTASGSGAAPSPSATAPAPPASASPTSARRACAGSRTASYSHASAGPGPSWSTSATATSSPGSARRDHAARASRGSSTSNTGGPATAGVTRRSATVAPGAEREPGPHVGPGRGGAPGEVGDGPGEAEHPVRTAQAQRAPVERGVHVGEETRVGAQPLAQPGAGHLGVGPPRRAPETLGRGLARCGHTPRDDRAGLRTVGGRTFDARDRSDLDLDVHAVEERSGQPPEVPA